MANLLICSIDCIQTSFSSSNLLSIAEADAGNNHSKNVPNVTKFLYDEFTSDKVKKIQVGKMRTI